MAYNSPEYKALLTCTDKLNASFSSDPLGIAGILLSKDLIPPNAENEMRVLGFSSHHKASILVEAIRNKVMTDPRSFTVLRMTLAEQSWTKDIADILRATYQRTTLNSQNCRPDQSK